MATAETTPAEPTPDETAASTETATALQTLEAAETDRTAKIDRAITDWINSDVRNSPIAQATPAWNHLMSVLPHLTSKLKEL